MLEFKTKEGEVFKLAVTGDVAEIAADVAVMIYKIYHEMQKANKQVAKLFKEMLTMSCLDGTLFGDRKTDTDKPEDDEDIDVKEEKNNKSNKSNDRAIAFLDMLIDTLKEAVKK